MREKRCDSKNHIFRIGESQEANGRYKFRYIVTLEGIALNEDVLYVFSIVMYGMPAMVILILISCGCWMIQK